MNPLILALLVGGGLYFYNQSQPKSYTITIGGNNNKNPNARKEDDLFRITIFDGYYINKDNKIIITNQKKMDNSFLSFAEWMGGLANTYKYDYPEATEDWFWDPGKFNNPNIDFFKYKIGINMDSNNLNEKKKAIKLIYDKNYKLINEYYYKWIKNLIQFQSNAQSFVNNSPRMIGSYLLLLKFSNVPENQWPGEDIKL